MLLHINSQWENWNHLFCHKVSFLTAPHCQFRDVGQCMKQANIFCSMLPMKESIFFLVGVPWYRYFEIGSIVSDYRYVPLFVNTSRFFPHSWLITRFVTRLTRQVLLVEQELITLPEHLSSPPIFSGVRVTRSLDLCVCFEKKPETIRKLCTVNLLI
jgi:hypothetical protein